MNKTGVTLICFFMFTFYFGTGQVSIKSLPDFGNKFASSQFVSECPNCKEFTAVQVPQYLKIMNFDSTIINRDFAAISKARLFSFDIINEKNEIKDVYVSVGTDGSLVAYGNVENLTSFTTDDRRRIDFLNIDTSKLKSVLKSELNLSNDSNLRINGYWNIQGVFVRKPSESEFLFDWVVTIPSKYGKNRYFIRTVVNEQMNFTVKQNLNISEMGIYDVNQLFVENNDIVHFHLTSSRESKKEGREKSINIGEEIFSSDYSDENGTLKAVYDEVVRFVSLIPENDIFRVEMDSLSFPDGQDFDKIIPDWSAVMLGDTRFFEVKNYILEISDSTGMAKLNLLEKQVGNSSAWRNWSFLGYSIFSNGKIFSEEALDKTQYSESTFEIIRHSSSTSDTLKVNFSTPMFFQDYCITKDGHLHILAKSRFNQSSFGAPIYRSLAKKSSSSTNGNEVNVEYYNGLNENIVSYISHIDIPMSGDLIFDGFARTTSCDISAMSADNNHFNAVFKNGSELLGKIEIGIYTLEEFRQDPSGLDSKEDASVYILINGYVFKYDTNSKVFWIGDGTKLKNVKNMNAAVDLAVRCFLSLQYNVENAKPICFD